MFLCRNSYTLRSKLDIQRRSNDNAIIYTRQNLASCPSGNGNVIAVMIYQLFSRQQATYVGTCYTVPIPPVSLPAVLGD